MADAHTPNHNFTLPEIGAAKDTWGTSLNANWTALDTLLRTNPATAVFLPRAGGTMAGAINMGANQITNLAASTAAGHAVRQDQVLLRTGGSMLGNIAMGGNKITGLGAASAAADAVRRDQVILADGSQELTSFLVVRSGGVDKLRMYNTSYSNADFGVIRINNDGVLALIAAPSGSSPYYFKSSSGTPDNNWDVMTRGMSDSRYMQQTWALTAGDGLQGGGSGAANRTISVDSTVVRTSGAQSIAGTKTFQGNVVFRSDQQTTYFDINDATQRDLVQVRRSGNGQWFIRLLANNTFEIAGAGSNMMRIGAPVELGLGDGPIYLENNADDGNGTGLCIRTSNNPTGNGMIFSVRSSGGALGFAVQQDKVSIGRAAAYIGADSQGAGGGLIMHLGLSAGAVGTHAFAADVVTSAGKSIGDTSPGANLRLSNAEGAADGSLAGTWRCLGRVVGGSSGWTSRSTLWLRIS